MKFFLIPLSLVFFCFNLCKAQSDECGAIPNAEHLQLMESHRESFAAFERMNQQTGRSSSNIVWVPIQIHDLRSSPYNGIAEYTKGFILGELNSLFLPYQIQFFECGLMNQVVDPVIANFDLSERSLLLPYFSPNAINIFFVEKLTNGAATYCGWGDLPDGNENDDFVIVSKGSGCMLDFDVFHHEIGHFLNLYHTHHQYNGIAELANGSNCSIGGDLICDTPADPNLYGVSLPNCQYGGGALDPNNQAYQPDPTNLMSYASFTCRDAFTPGQMSRMLYCIQNIRTLTGCSVPYSCDNPISSFPYVEDFENGLGEWTTLASNDFPLVPMITASGPLLANVPSPPSAKSGIYYAQPDTTNYGPFRYFGLLSPCIDLSTTINPELSFWYYLEGDAQTQIAAQYSTDGGNTMQQFNPQVITASTSTAGWQQYVIDLTPYVASDFFQVRIAGSMMTTFPALDSIVIRDAYVPPCTLSTVHYQSDLYCHGDSNGVISVDLIGSYTAPFDFQWSNGGTDPSIQGLTAGTYTVTITDANGCVAIESYSITEPSLIVTTTSSTDATPAASDGTASVSASGGTPSYQYLWSNGGTSATISNVPAGNYTVTVTDANFCTIEATVTVGTAVQCDRTYRNFPYSGSFEPSLGIFRQETALDDENWRKRSGATPTKNTGPSSANTGAYYRYMEASVNRNRPGKAAILKSKRCLDLTSLSQPVFELYYHLYGNQMGALEIQVSLDDEVSWMTAFSVSGDQGNQWYQLSVDLTPWKTDHTKLRIVGTTGNGGRSDIAIDDYYLGEAGSNSADLLPIETAVAAVQLDQVDLRVYPNPARDRLNIQLPAAFFQEDQVQVVLFDLSGRKVIDRSMSVAETLSLALVGQIPGYYFLKVSNSTTVKHTKIVIAGDN